MSFTSSAFGFVKKSIITLLCVSCGLVGAGWRWLDGPQSTIDVAGPVARTQTHVFYVTLWVTSIIFVIVAGVLAYATLKFKARSTDDEHAPPPPQGHGNPLIELSLIVASVLALVIIAVPTLHAIWYQYDVPEAERANAYEINATGYQWWFRFEYPGEQINGAGDLVCANELVIPAGRPVRINLRSVDVIHSFWVPKLAGKVDMIPNRGNHMWLEADKPGYFWGQCAEYCGESHAVMRFRVIALNEKDFADWLANQKSPARTVSPESGAKAEFASYEPKKFPRNAPGWSDAFDADPMNAWVKMQFPEKGEDPALIAKGRKLFQEKTCIGCHTVRGHEGVGITGPDLTHLGARTTIAGGLLENTAVNLHRWITDPNSVKPGNKMWKGGYTDPATGNVNFTVNDEEAKAIVAYLHSLK